MLVLARPVMFVSILSGAQSESFADHRLRRFWIAGLLAIFIHAVVDPLVTYYAVNVHGVGIETNVWLSEYLNDGWQSFLLIHLPLYLLIFIFFIIFSWLFTLASEPEKQQIYRLTMALWLLIATWGMILVTNNVWVLLTRIS